MYRGILFCGGSYDYPPFAHPPPSHHFFFFICNIIQRLPCQCWVMSRCHAIVASRHVISLWAFFLFISFFQESDWGTHAHRGGMICTGAAVLCTVLSFIWWSIVGGFIALAIGLFLATFETPFVYRCFEVGVISAMLLLLILILILMLSLRNVNGLRLRRTLKREKGPPCPVLSS